MKPGDLVKSRGGSTLALVIEITYYSACAAARILLNDGQRIWVDASMLEIVNAAG